MVDSPAESRMLLAERKQRKRKIKEKAKKEKHVHATSIKRKPKSRHVFSSSERHHPKDHDPAALYRNRAAESDIRSFPVRNRSLLI